MSILRRILGILVMIAGILGIVISVAGLVGVWMAKPDIVVQLTTTVDTLQVSVDTSQEAMGVTQEALGATVESLDALSVMLAATATSVEDTAPVIDQATVMMGENLPGILEGAVGSLQSAQEAAVVMDSAVRSLEAFQIAMGAVPLISGFVEAPTETYNPDQPLSESLGEVAENLDGLPAMFEQMSKDMARADDNLGTIESSLTTMSQNVEFIAGSLGEYQTMVGQSQSAMADLHPLLISLQGNLTRIVDGVSLALTLFLLWLLAIQVVVLTQGWELYQGTAGHMEDGEADDPVVKDSNE